MKVCSSESEFIMTVAPAAQKAGKRYNMLPSILIAQSALELGYAIKSYWDNPSIADLLKYENMVGQKRFLLNDSWSDKSVWPGRWFTKETPEEYNGKLVTIKDDFRIFDEPNCQHSNLSHRKYRYRSNFVHNSRGLRN